MALYELYSQDSADGERVFYQTLEDVLIKLSLIAGALESTPPAWLQAEVFSWTDEAECHQAWADGTIEDSLLLRLNIPIMF